MTVRVDKTWQRDFPVLIEPDRLGSIFAGIALFVALSVLILGWGLDVTFFQRVALGLAAMVPQSAMVAGLLSLGLIGLHTGTTRGRMLALGSSLLAMGIALDNSIWLVRNSEAIATELEIMSIKTTITFELLAVGTFVAALERKHFLAQLPSFLATIGTVLSWIVIAGHALHAPELYTLPFFAGASIPTAITMLLLNISLLLSGSDKNWTREFFRPTPSSREGLMLLPMTAFLPIAIIWIIQLPAFENVFPGALKLPIAGLIVSALLVLVVIFATRSRNIVATENDGLVSYLHNVLDGLDVAALVYDGNGKPRGANIKSFDFVSKNQTPFEWLEQTTFHEPGTRTPLLGARSPKSMLIDTGQLGVMHVAWISSTQGERYLRISKETPRAGGSNITVLTVFDETELWKLRSSQNEMERQESIAVLAGGIAHELGNFLGVIRLAADGGTLANPPERINEAFQLITEACNRGSRLSEKLLQMSHSDVGFPAATDIGAAISRVSAMSRVQENVKDFTFVATPSDRPLWAYVDPAELDSAILNLVLNAFHALKEADIPDPHISLFAYPTDDSFLAIEVSDNGPGMDADTLEHATDAFFTTRENAGGTGMGLLMVKNFAQLSYGSFELFSEPGKGTCAKLTLPRIAAPGNALVASADEILAGRKIHFLESDEVLRTLLPQALTLLGAEVHTVTTLRSAIGILQELESDTVDLLIANAQMVGPIWQELSASAPNLKAIMLAEPQDRADAYLESSAMVLRKPVPLRAILKAVSVLLPERRPDGSLDE